MEQATLSMQNKFTYFLSQFFLLIHAYKSTATIHIKQVQDAEEIICHNRDRTVLKEGLLTFSIIEWHRVHKTFLIHIVLLNSSLVPYLI